MYSVQGILNPTTPFDFHKSLEFLSQFRPSMGQQIMHEGVLTKASSLNGQVFVFQVRTIETIDQPQIAYTLFCAEEISDTFHAAVRQNLSFFLSLDDDLTPFYALAEKDIAFVPVVQALYGYHQVKFSMSVFENTAWAMLSAHNRIPLAQQMKRRLVELFGATLRVNETDYHAFPEPEDLRKATVEQLTEALGNHNERRAGYLLAAAEAFDRVDADWLKTAPSDDIRSWLLRIKGIGAWSASFVLIRGLGRMDVLDVPEARLVEAASRVYGRSLTADEVLTLAAGYGDYRGYWAHYLRAYSA